MPRLVLFNVPKNVFIVSDKKEVSGGFLLQPNICIGSLLICTYAVRDIMWKEILSYSRSVKLATYYFSSQLWGEGGYIWLENIHV
jgi:hypothetical protein